MKVSNLLGTEILSKDKKMRVTVMSVCHAKNQIEGYICFNERQNELFIERLYVGKDRQVYFNEFKKIMAKHKSLRLGLPAYTNHGKYLGRVEDYLICGTRLSKVKINSRQYSAECVSLGNAAIVNIDTQKAQVEIAAKDMFIATLCQS